MPYAHVRTLAPNGERLEAWRCEDPNCRRLRIGPRPQRQCPHWRTPTPPQPRSAA